METTNKMETSFLPKPKELAERLFPEGPDHAREYISDTLEVLQIMYDQEIERAKHALSSAEKDKEVFFSDLPLKPSSPPPRPRPAEY